MYTLPFFIGLGALSWPCNMSNTSLRWLHMPQPQIISELNWDFPTIRHIREDEPFMMSECWVIFIELVQGFTEEQFSLDGVHC